MARFVLAVLLFAVLVYALMWAIERRRAGGSGGSGRFRGGGNRGGRPRGPSPRQAAPDDDEDFLRWLDRKRRKDKGAPD